MDLGAACSRSRALPTKQLSAANDMPRELLAMNLFHESRMGVSKTQRPNIDPK